MARSLLILLVTLVVSLILSPPDLAAQAAELPVVQIEVWTELDPIVAEARPVDRSIAVGRLLDEAAYVLSAMVYGSEFRYVPSDPARGVAEEFELLPRASITRGDPALRVSQTWVEGDLLYARMYYELRAEQIGWFSGWRSAAIPTSAARGTTPFIRGPLQKTQAYSDAIKQAIRAHARALEFNRPRAITGAVILAETPGMIIREGSYEADVSIALQIDEIEPYSVY